MTRVIVDESACTGCGQCVLICPVDALRFRAGTGKAMAAYADDCDGCRLCLEECPADCIRIDDLERAEGVVSIYDALGIEDPYGSSGASTKGKET